MRASPARQLVSEEEYLALEEGSDVRHEWLNGEMVAMAGGSDRHNRLAANLVGELHQRLRSSPCRPVGSDQRLEIEATRLYTYPDVSVRCREHPGAPALTRVVFEVLSESTERWDRGDKFAHYQQDPSIEEYVLVSQRRRRVEHFRRLEPGRWALTVYGPDDVVELPAIGVSLPVRDLYDGAEAEASDDPEDPYRLG